MKTSLTSNLIIISSFAINIGISDWYLFSRLCRPSTALVRAVFVATFGLSGSLLELCLWEINGTLQNEYFYIHSLWLIVEREEWHGKLL
jgi:hypothetical protein